MSPSRAPTEHPTESPIGLTTTHNPSKFPSNSPSVFPSLAPTVPPSVSPSASPTHIYSPSMFPTAFPSVEPTASPSNAPNQYPSQYPTQVPSLAPTIVPSTSPAKSLSTALPSKNPFQSTSPTQIPSTFPNTSFPKTFPSVVPTQTTPLQTPSQTPSQSPTGNPSMYPTITPTTAPSYTDNRDNFISSSDISFTNFGSFSTNDDNSTFNPGFRNKFYSKTDIQLTNTNFLKIFENWLDSDNIYNSSNGLNITINWQVISVTNDERRLIGTDVNLNNISISQYISYDLTKYNNSFGIFTIEAYYILNSDDNSNNNIFSVGICDYDDDDIFESNNAYIFIYSIDLQYTNTNDSSLSYSASSSTQTTLIANSAPSNGHCTLTKISENSNNSETELDSLVETFSVDCFGWIDNDTLLYNFIYDDLFFLNSNYSNTTTITTPIGIGNKTLTAVILDSNSMPTCVDINVVGESLYPNISYAIDILQSFNYSENIVQASLEIDIIFDVINEALTTEEWDDSEIASLQESIISSYLDNIEDLNITSVDQVSAMLAVLASITVPLIDTSGEVTPIYNASIVSRILNIIDDQIITFLQDVVISGVLESVDSDTASYAFGMID